MSRLSPQQVNNVDSSKICDESLREEVQVSLREKVQAIKEQQWNDHHASFLIAYNRMVAEEGVALQEWQAF